MGEMHGLVCEFSLLVCEFSLCFFSFIVRLCDHLGELVEGCNGDERFGEEVAEEWRMEELSSQLVQQHQQTLVVFANRLRTRNVLGE